MKKYKPVMSFDDKVADVYDDLAERGDEAATVAFLEHLARGGPALELAIGTGRIALPLSMPMTALSILLTAMTNDR
jgi:ubiquinone/menaquinone biosynthesis C-methylase UbiE